MGAAGFTSADLDAFDELMESAFGAAAIRTQAATARGTFDAEVAHAQGGGRSG